MTDDQKNPKIIVDSDWKQQAQKEKEQLNEQLKEKTPPPQPPGASFFEIVNILVMQATVGLAGYKAPTGETLPPDLQMAKHFIDLIEILQEKTQGHLEPDEQKFLQTVLYELRLRYVEIADALAAAVKEQDAKPAS